jgi:hypothetical protein
VTPGRRCCAGRSISVLFATVAAAPPHGKVIGAAKLGYLARWQSRRQRLASACLFTICTPADAGSCEVATR